MLEEFRLKIICGGNGWSWRWRRRVEREAGAEPVWEESDVGGSATKMNEPGVVASVTDAIRTIHCC